MPPTVEIVLVPEVPLAVVPDELDVVVDEPGMVVVGTVPELVDVELPPGVVVGLVEESLPTTVEVTSEVDAVLVASVVAELASMIGARGESFT